MDGGNFMLDIDFDDGMINKLAEIICGDDYHEKFCEDITLTKCPVYRTTGQLYEFFQDLLEIEDGGYSRLPFTIDCLKKLNNLNRMDEVLIKLTNPKAYLDEKIITFIINEVNEVIKWEGIEIVLQKNKPVIIFSDEEVEINLKDEITEDFPVLEFKHLIKDEILSKIMNKRWLEIKRTYESESYLSTIVLLGSVLEGLLYYYVSSNFKTVKSVSSAPKDRSGELIPIDNWKLNDLIKVAHECKWLDDDIKTFNEGLRDYRNLIHPKLQKQKLITPDKDTCKICIDVVIAAFNDLKDKNFLN